VVLIVLKFSTTAEPEAETPSDTQATRIEAVPLTDPIPAIDLGQALDFDDHHAATVRISLDTVPTGAEVFRAGESIGLTPINTDFPQNAQNERWQLFLDGFEVAEVEVSLDSDFHSEIVLSRLSPTTAPTPRPVASSGGGTQRPATGGSGASSGGTTATKRPKDPPKEEKKAEVKRTVITETTGAALPD